MKYKIEVTFSRPKFRDASYVREFNINYNDDTFQECEKLIRDHLLDVGNSFIDEAWYGKS